MRRRGRSVYGFLVSILLSVATSRGALAVQPAFAPVVLSASPASVLTGQPVLFTVSGLPAVNGPIVLVFGDGAAQVLSGPTVVTHVYVQPGFYSAHVDVFGKPAAFANVRVATPVPRVPAGIVYSATLSVSPVAAGAQTEVLLNYGLDIEPTTLPSQNLALEAVVDLRDARGTLLRRSDALPVYASPFEGPSVRSLRIPYSVPLDASGAYSLTVALRTVAGGRVLVTPPIPLRVLPGPDPAPALKSAVRGSGAIDIGPATPSRESVNAAITTELQFRSSALGITGTTDPLSSRSDATVYLRSGKPGPVRAPDAQGGGAAKTSTGWLIADGRTIVTLPQVLGGGDVVRGLFGEYGRGHVHVDAASGSSALAFDGLQRQHANVFGVSYDDAKTKAGAHVIAVRDDTSSGFFGASEQSVTTVASLERHLSQRLDVSGDIGFAHVNGLTFGAPSGSDAGDDVAVNYANSRTVVSATYSNAGALFGAVGGPGAAGDQATTAMNAQFGLGARGTLMIGATQATTRSVYSRVTNADVGYVLALPNALAFSLTATRVASSSAGVDTDADTGSLSVSRAWEHSSFGLSESLTAMRDRLGGALNAVVRTTSLNWTKQQGPRQLALGLNAMNNAPMPTVGGMSPFGIPLLTGLASTGASVVYALPIGRPGTFETQAYFSTTNTSGALRRSIDRDLAVTLSRHIGRHLALGLKYEILSHRDTVPGYSTVSPGLRIHLEVTQ